LLRIIVCNGTEIRDPFRLHQELDLVVNLNLREAVPPVFRSGRVARVLTTRLRPCALAAGSLSFQKSAATLSVIGRFRPTPVQPVPGTQFTQLSGPENSLEPTSTTYSVACLLLCLRAQFGRG